MIPGDYFDLCMILIILVVSFWGILWGFVQALSVVLATGVGMLVSQRLTHSTCVSLGFSAAGIGSYIVGFVLFALASMLVYKVMNFVGFLIKKSKLSAWNHILGLILGFALSLILCWCVAWGMMLFPKSASTCAHSRSAKYLVELAEFGRNQAAQAVHEQTEVPDENPESAGTNPSTPEFYQGFIERIESAGEISETEPEIPLPETEEGANSWVHEFLDQLDAYLRPILLSQEV